jgi:hypothetical protein
MHYSSWAFDNPELVAVDPTDPDYYPMARLDNGKKSLLPYPIKPFAISQGDKDAIKRMYSWSGS